MTAAAMLDWWVWLSGAVPDLDDLQRHGWSEIDIRFMVARIVERCFTDGYGIVHGNHPTYTPIVEQVARGFPGAEPRVRIVTSRFHFETPDDEARFTQRHAYADIELTERRTTRLESMTVMRMRLAERCDAVVCIGGRLHSDGSKRPGVEEEIEIALRDHRCTYLLGRFGGFTAKYYEQEIRGHEDKLQNGLDREENRVLAEDASPIRVLKILMKGLRQARDASRGARP
jgi:hypothetical protein